MPYTIDDLTKAAQNGQTKVIQDIVENSSELMKQNFDKTVAAAIFLAQGGHVDALPLIF